MSDYSPERSKALMRDVRALAAERDALAARVREQEEALRKIEAKGANREVRGQYEYGLQAGHEECAAIARAALAKGETL